MEVLESTVREHHVSLPVQNAELLQHLQAAADAAHSRGSAVATYCPPTDRQHCGRTLLPQRGACLTSASLPGLTQVAAGGHSLLSKPCLQACKYRLGVS